MRCVIITGGSIKNINLLKKNIKKDDYIICVDGGAHYAVLSEIIPNLLIGDFDSIHEKELEKLKNKGVKIKKFIKDKDDTDTALAVKEAISLNPSEILLFGAIGTRFDHSLANVHLLLPASQKGIKAKLINEFNEISLVLPGKKAIITGNRGDTFSLLPLTAEVTGVSVKGSKWELENAIFKIGNPYGISNQFLFEKVEVSIMTGILLVIKVIKE